MARRRPSLVPVAALVLCALVSLPGQRAEARELMGQKGIGVESALGFKGPSASASGDLHRPLGFSFVFGQSELFALQLIGGLSLAAGSGADATIAAGLTVRGLYHGLPLGDSVTLVIPMGLGYHVQSFEIGDLGHFVHLEAGLRPEWFVADFLSVHTQAGVTVSLLLGQQNVLPSYDPGVSIDLFGAVDLFGKAGFTVWF